MRKPFPKHLPMSALIAGLLASPALGGVPLVQGRQSPAGMVVEEFPLVMPVTVEEEARRVARGERLDAYGMTGLQKRMAREMQVRLAQMTVMPRGQRIAPVMVERVMRMEKATYLGIATSPVTGALGSQLHLDKGMGLVVDYVEKDSPADGAGLMVHDVLQKLDDQLLINTEQFRVLVRAKKAGDVVKFSLIRGGQPVVISVKLIEKEVVEPSMPAEVMPGGAGPKVTSHSMSATRVDDKYQITLSSEGDGKKVVAKDLKGNVVYQGGAETEAEMRAMPAEVAERVKMMLEKIK